MKALIKDRITEEKFCSGIFATREDAVDFLKKELETWMVEGDRLTWKHTPKSKKACLKPDLCFISDVYGDYTDTMGQIIE